jgi:hypothetical protein
LTRTALAGGTVLVKESRPPGGVKTYTAQILNIKSGDVRAATPYKLNKLGQKIPRKTVRHFIIEFEEI